MGLNLRIAAASLIFLGLFTQCGSEEPASVIVNKDAYERAANIIPAPIDVQLNDGQFQIDENTKLFVTAGFEPEAQLLANWINENPALNIVVQKLETAELSSDESNYILLKSDAEKFNSTANPNEAYELIVNPNVGIEITAGTGIGALHGIQTLRQMLGHDLSDVGDENRMAVTASEIQDAPNFKHRGLLLDCARHFMDKDFVKRYIDLLSYHKMNVLHWHLTEDQGWRIEIEKYPELTTIGAWRDDVNNEQDGERYGGFYTQNDIREIVAYANQRHVTIIPEIELPGHSQAALAAYPQFSCTGGPFEVETEWGVFREIYCAGNDSTFQFIEDVLTEVIALFPGEYVHIGGDEAPKYRWEHCDKCQKRIADEGLHDAHELQSYFITRVEKFLNSKGKKLIGWDEILEGGLSPNATVQSWRGMQGGIDAAKSGHDAIMSPTSHCYFDYDLNSIDMEKVYAFDPIPSDLTAEEQAHIIGGECNLWSERAPQNTVDSKVFPRMLALAEVLWSYPETRDYKLFYSRTVIHNKRLKAMGVDVGLPTVALAVNSKIDAENNIEITLEKGMDDLRFTSYWTSVTGGRADEIPYVNPFVLDRQGADELMVQIYRDDELLESESFKFHGHKGNGSKLNLGYEYSPNYTGGGENAILDGFRGSTNFRDGHWQALQKNDAVATVDLGEKTELTTLTSGYNQYNNSWIFLPLQVEYFMSDDGENFTSIGVVKAEYDPKTKGQFTQDFSLDVQGESARYVKMVATNIGHCPDWHDAAGSEAWLFIDEFIIE